MGEAASSGRVVCECVATVPGHDGAVSCVVAAGEHLYSASAGNDIRMWELPDLAPCSAHQFAAASADPLCSVKAMLVADHRLFGAHQDHKIRVWRRSLLPSPAAAAAAAELVNDEKKPTTLQPIATLPLFKHCFWKSLWQSNYVQVRRHHKKLWIQHTDTISSLAVGKAQQVLYSASWDKTVKVWRMADLKCVESISAHDDAINALAVCDKSGVLYTGSADGKVKAWGKGGADGTVLQMHAACKERHRLLATMEGGHQKGASVNALAVSEGGEFVVSAGSDGALAVWGREKGEAHVISKMLQKLAGCHAQPILCLCACKLQLQQEQEPGLLIFMSGSADKTVRLWQLDVATAGRSGAIKMACVGVLRGHGGAVKSICVAPSNSADHEALSKVMNMSGVMGGGSLVYTGSADKTIKAWWVKAGLGLP
ncbi:hypothetical protein L7F22_030437 [Adiantum nelumboides]|nr:hypothetical protein [Adiantum nelumboides]